MEPPARIPAIRASSVWPEEEEHTLVKKYRESRFRGVGYKAIHFLWHPPYHKTKRNLRALKGNGLLPSDDERSGTPPLQAVGGVRVIDDPVLHSVAFPQVEDSITFVPIPRVTVTPPAPTAENRTVSSEVSEAVVLDNSPISQLPSSFVGGVPQAPTAPWIICLRSLGVEGLPLAQRLLALEETDGDVSVSLDRLVGQLSAAVADRFEGQA